MYQLCSHYPQQAAWPAFPTSESISNIAVRLALPFKVTKIYNYLTCLSVYLPAYLPTSLPASLSPGLPACSSFCLFCLSAFVFLTVCHVFTGSSGPIAVSCRAVSSRVVPFVVSCRAVSFLPLPCSFFSCRVVSSCAVQFLFVSCRFFLCGAVSFRAVPFA